MTEQDDWALTGDQMLFMLRSHNLIEAWQASDDPALSEQIRQLAESDAFKSLFGAMSFDEAYDRYETMLEEGSSS